MFPWFHRDPRQEFFMQMLHQHMAETLMADSEDNDEQSDDEDYHWLDQDPPDEFEEERPAGGPDTRRSTGMTSLDESPVIMQPEKVDGVFAWGSSDGRRFRENADQIKERGNEALRKKHYAISIALYSDAMKEAMMVCNNEEQIALLFSNRSHAHLKVKEYDMAGLDASMCVKLKPTWYKGCLRLMAALKGKGDNIKAIKVGFDIVTRINLPSSEWQLKIFCDILVLADQTPGGFKPLKETLTSEKIWTDVLLKLCSIGHWHTVHVLINGNDDTKPLMTNYRIADVKLAGLLEKCEPEDWIKWGEKLAQTLIEKGASRQSLDPEGKHPLHAALKVGIRTGIYGLLGHLFSRYIPIADRDRRDDEGNTLLHVACRDVYDTKKQAIKLLLDNNLDPTTTNNSGQLPISLLPPGDEMFITLRSAMGKKGYDSTKLQMTTVPPGSTHRHDPVSAEPPSGTKPRPVRIPYQPSASFMTRVRSPKSFEANKWSSVQVKQWLNENLHAFVENSVRDAEGPQLVELRMILETSPKYFYSHLRKNMTASPIQMLKLANSLRQLV